MNKFSQIASIALIVSVAICSASPARLEKLKPSKSKFLARQEVAEDVPAPTPYPPAGIKPEIPFNLPTDEKLVAPANHYLPPIFEAERFSSPPDQVYGPPAQVYGPPAQTYGPPEVSVKDEVEEVEAKVETVQPGEQPADEEVQPEETKPEEAQPEEFQPEEVQPPQAEEAKPSEQPEVQAEPEQSASGVEQVAVEEGADNALPEHLVLAKRNNRKAAQLRSAKLQLRPVAIQRQQQLVAPQPIYLVGGSLYSYNGQLFRV